MTSEPPKPNPSSKTSGRGSTQNPVNRFIPIAYEPPALDFVEGGTITAEDLAAGFSPRLAAAATKTKYFVDDAKTILTENKSPDLPFQFNLNPYRGCEHGCAYCYARPSHEYLELSAGIDFETKIFVKQNAPELLRKKLQSNSWKGDRIFMSGITDGY